MNHNNNICCTVLMLMFSCGYMIVLRFVCACVQNLPAHTWFLAYHRQILQHVGYGWQSYILDELWSNIRENSLSLSICILGIIMAFCTWYECSFLNECRHEEKKRKGKGTHNDADFSGFSYKKNCFFSCCRINLYCSKRVQ